MYIKLIHCRKKCLSGCKVKINVKIVLTELIGHESDDVTLDWCSNLV